jgi:SEC-C motif-containing protein
MAPGFARDSGPCPCGGNDYDRCCGPLHRGERRAGTAEQLMRSRYSAFARGEVDYLLQTHDQSESRRALRQACRQTQWLGLSILAVDGGGADDLEGTVRFEARHREGVLVETSLFQRRGGALAGEWLYIRAIELDHQ